MKDFEAEFPGSGYSVAPSWKRRSMACAQYRILVIWIRSRASARVCAYFVRNAETLYLLDAAVSTGNSAVLIHLDPHLSSAVRVQQYDLGERKTGCEALKGQRAAAAFCQQNGSYFASEKVFNRPKVKLRSEPFSADILQQIQLQGALTNILPTL